MGNTIKGYQYKGKMYYMKPLYHMLNMKLSIPVIALPMRLSCILLYVALNKLKIQQQTLPQADVYLFIAGTRIVKLQLS